MAMFNLCAQKKTVCQKDGYKINQTYHFINNYGKKFFFILSNK